MAYVITRPCIGTKDRSCVEVCPVDCFYNFKNPELNNKYGTAPKAENDPGMLVINPDECINCGACETECPVEAIYEDTGVPDNMKEFVQLNADALAGFSNSQLDEIRVTSR
jgi:NAD-dependent dihydropyrimidine dehydrogenase PreA subunit